jgi:FtsH-binding integral membrane protein
MSCVWWHQFSNSRVLCELFHNANRAVGPMLRFRRMFMTLAEYSFGAFAVLNVARLVGYIPQMLRVHRDRNGAEAVSLATWCLFAAANLATVSYAYVVANDAAMTIVFSLNAFGCLAIAGLTAWKRIERAHWRAIHERGSHEGVR